MTREETKQRIAAMQAYVDGKQIQLQLPDGKWAGIPNPDWVTDANYRIKPEPKYRPCKDADECWQDMTQEEENRHIKKLKDAGFDCGSSRSMLETIQLLKLSEGETRKI